MTKIIKNATMNIETTKDENFERTALKMNSNSNSFDLLDRNGNVIARINVLETDVYYDIDVIRNEKITLNNRVTAWNNGEQILNENLPPENRVIVCLLNKN